MVNSGFLNGMDNKKDSIKKMIDYLTEKGIGEGGAVSYTHLAKRAMGFLKEHRAGRATFLPITAIKGRVLSEQGLDDQCGFGSIASDLVAYDNKYSEISRWLLGRTAVAEDIDAAIAIAKKYSYRCRIVTLDGQVINAGGSMTGGDVYKRQIPRARSLRCWRKRASADRVRTPQ